MSTHTKRDITHNNCVTSLNDREMEYSNVVGRMCLKSKFSRQVSIPRGGLKNNATDISVMSDYELLHNNVCSILIILGLCTHCITSTSSEALPTLRIEEEIRNVVFDDVEAIPP